MENNQNFDPNSLLRKPSEKETIEIKETVQSGNLTGPLGDKRKLIIAITGVIILILAGVFVGLVYNNKSKPDKSELSQAKNNQAQVPASSEKNNEAIEKKPENKEVPKPIEYLANVAFERNNKVIYNGKELGEGRMIALAGNNIGYLKGEHVIVNEKDLGPVTQNTPFGEPQAHENDIASFVSIGGKDHLFINDVDKGEFDVTGLYFGDIVHFDYSEGNIIYTKKVGGKYIVYFNNKALGEGRDPKLYKNNYVYINKDYHAIYNGKDLGPAYRAAISEAGVAYQYRKQSDGDNHIYLNGKDMGVGEGPKLVGKNLGFFRTISSDPKLMKSVVHIIYNGTDLGEGQEFNMWNDDIVYKLGDHIMFKGKDYGLGFGPRTAGGSIAFIQGVGDRHIIYDGNDLGSGDNPEISAKLP